MTTQAEWTERWDQGYTAGLEAGRLETIAAGHDLAQGYRDRAERAEAEAARLREALKYYANVTVLYLGHGDYRTAVRDLMQDNGATARAALAPEPDTAQCNGSGWLHNGPGFFQKCPGCPACSEPAQ